MVRGTCEDRRPTALNTPRRKRTGEGGESLLLCKQTITSLPEECSAQILQGARPEECLAQGQEGRGTSRRESLCVLNRPAPTVVPRPPVEVGGPCSPIHPLPRLRHPPPDARLSHLTGRGGGGSESSGTTERKPSKIWGDPGSACAPLRRQLRGKRSGVWFSEPSRGWPLGSQG